MNNFSYLITKESKRLFPIGTQFRCRKTGKYMVIKNKHIDVINNCLLTEDGGVIYDYGWATIIPRVSKFKVGDVIEHKFLKTRYKVKCSLSKNLNNDVKIFMLVLDNLNSSETIEAYSDTNFILINKDSSDGTVLLNKTFKKNKIIIENI